MEHPYDEETDHPTGRLPGADVAPATQEYPRTKSREVALAKSFTLDCIEVWDRRHGADPSPAEPSSPSRTVPSQDNQVLLRFDLAGCEARIRTGGSPYWGNLGTEPARDPQYLTGVTNLLKYWAQAKPWEKEIGRGYYHDQREKVLQIGRGYQTSLLQATGGKGYRDEYLMGAFAALSPNTSEIQNYRALERELRHAAKLPGWNHAVAYGYPKNRDKAYKLLTGQVRVEMVFDFLRGQKVQAFYMNMLNPEDPEWVTVDGHMYSVWHGRRFKLRGEVKLGRVEYRRIAAGVKEAAGLTKDKFLPCQFQAVVWMVWRRVNRILWDPQMKLEMER